MIVRLRQNIGIQKGERNPETERGEERNIERRSRERTRGT